MPPRRIGIGRLVVVVAIVAIMLVALGANFLFFASPPAASTGATTTSSPTLNSTSSYSSSSTEQVTEFNTTVSSPSGLELRVFLNTTATASGGAVDAQLTLFNPLDRNLSLVPSFSANSAISSWNGYDFFCGENNFLPMLGYAVFQGHYSQVNISLAGSPLQLAPQVDVGCVTYPKPTSVVFLPNGDSAVLYSPAWSTGYQEPVTTDASTESCLLASTGAYVCGDGKGLSGYWTTTSPITEQEAAIGSKNFSYFSPGEYTLAVQDVWNQTVYAHFQVTTSGLTPVTIDDSLLGYCPSVSTNSSGFMSAAAGGNSPAVICVKFYYFNAFKGYNASSPLVLNITNALSIQALEYLYGDGSAYPQSFSGAQNFTLVVSRAQLAIGGPTNENEGVVVAFALTANSGANGKYQLGFFPSASFGTWLLGPQEPEECGYYGVLTAGTGFPNYAQDLGSCLTYPISYDANSTGTGGSSFYTLSDLPYPLLIGNLYFSVTSVTNSTGY